VKTPARPAAAVATSALAADPDALRGASADARPRLVVVRHGPVETANAWRYHAARHHGDPPRHLRHAARERPRLLLRLGPAQQRAEDLGQPTRAGWASRLAGRGLAGTGRGRGQRVQLRVSQRGRQSPNCRTGAAVSICGRPRHPPPSAPPQQMSAPQNRPTYRPRSTCPPTSPSANAGSANAPPGSRLSPVCSEPVSPPSHRRPHRVVNPNARPPPRCRRQPNPWQRERRAHGQGI